MREQWRDSVRRRSSPSRPRDRDRRDLVGSNRCNVSGRFARSPAYPDWDSRGLDVGRRAGVARDWGPDSGGIRREYGDSIPCDVERRRRDGSSKREPEEERDDEHRRKLSRLHKDAFAGEVYPNRSDPVEARLVGSVTSEERLTHGFGGSMRSGEELYWSHEAERSSTIGSLEFGNFVRPTAQNYRTGGPGPSGSISSRDYNYSVSPERKVFRYDEGDQSGLYGSRSHSDSARLQMEPYRTSELERNKAVIPAMKGEHGGVQYYEDGRRRDYYVPRSPASRVEFLQDNYERVSLNSSCGFGGSDSNRIDDRNLEIIGNCCASRVLCNRDHDGYFDRNLSRVSQKDKKAKSFRDFSFSRVLTDYNSRCHASPSGTKRSKEMVGDSRKCYHGGCSPVSEPAVKYISRDRHTENMGREADLAAKYVPGDKVDGAETFLGISTRERTFDQYDSSREVFPFVQPRSRVVEGQDEEACHFRKAHPEERKDVYLDRKSHQLRKDLRFGVEERVYPDVNGPDVAVERDERAMHIRRVCLDEGKDAYLDNERQKLQNDYNFDSYARIYPDVGGSSAFVSGSSSAFIVKQDEEALRFRRDGRTQVYLEDESLQLGKDNHFDLHARRVHPHGRRDAYSNDETLHSSDDYGFKSHMLGESVESLYEARDETMRFFTAEDSAFRGEHEKMAHAISGHVEHLRTTFVKPESGKFQRHEGASDYRDQQWRDEYEMELTSSELRRSMDDRTIDCDNHQLSSCPRIPAKERLGGRVKDLSVSVRKPLGAGRKFLPWVKKIIPNRKSFGRNHENTSKVHRFQSNTSSNSKKGKKKLNHTRT